MKSMISDLVTKSQRSGGNCIWVAFVALLFPLAIFAEPTVPFYSITDFVTCESARTNAPHDWHVPQATFRITDDKFFAWVELRDVSGMHPVEIKLHRPDGTYYGEETQAINETNGIANWWRMVAWWEIKGEDIAKIPGDWKLDLVIDGTLQRSISFRLSPGSSLPVVTGQSGYANSVMPAQVTVNPRMVSSPLVNLVKAVTVSFSNLTVGTDYQLQVSSDLNSWTNFGTPITATNSFMTFTNYWNVSDWNQLFFRLH
jgi:hypothetical protein